MTTSTVPATTGHPETTATTIPFSGAQAGTAPSQRADDAAAHASATDGPHAIDRPLGSSSAPPAQGSKGPSSPSPSQNVLSQTAAPSGDPGPDPAILEALRTAKERLYVLKLADAMESLILERNAGKSHARTTFQPATTYQRLLIHRCSGYYRLLPEPEQATKSIIVMVTSDSRIPLRRISELVPAEANSNQPTFKIMRRTTPDQRNKSRTTNTSASGSTLSAPGSVSSEVGSSVASPITLGEVMSPLPNGADTDDPEEVLRTLGVQPPKTRSAPGTTTPRKTIEEREAAYAEAKRRIFSDFSEKEKEAAKLREDREREREVRDLHRELAAEEDEYRAGSSIQPGSVPYPGPSLHSNPSDDLPSMSSGEPSTSTVYFATLYDPSTTLDDVQPVNEPATVGHEQQYPQPPPPAPPFDPPQSHYPTPYPVGPYQAGPYPGYPPPGAGGMMMPPVGAFPPYQGQPMQMGMVSMMPYGYYPPPPWADAQGNYAQPAPGMENPYGMYPVAMQQPPLWAPPPPPQGRQHQAPRQSHDGPPGPAQGHPPPVLPNGTNFVPQPAPYFNNPAPQQQPFPGQPMRPPNGGNFPFHPPQPPPPQRQLWTPNGGNGKRDPQNRNGPNGPQRPGSGSRTSSFAPRASLSPSSQPVILGLTSPTHSARNGTGARDFAKPGPPASTLIQATPMSMGPVGTGARSRGSSISSASGRSALGLGRGMWGSGVLGGMSPVSPHAGSLVSNLSSPDPSAEMGVLVGKGVLSRALGARRGSGSVSGSGSNGGESGTRTPLDETASVASSSISSASSSRTFTSTSSKHPSLPPRPDWSIGQLNLLHAASSRASMSSQSSTRANPRSVSSGGSNPAHSRSHSSQSHPRASSSYPSLGPADWPPLPGAGPHIGQGMLPEERPLMTLVPQGTVWSDSARRHFMMTGVNQNGFQPLPALNGTCHGTQGFAAQLLAASEADGQLLENKLQAGVQVPRSSTPIGVPRSTPVVDPDGVGLVDGKLAHSMASLDVSSEAPAV